MGNNNIAYYFNVQRTNQFNIIMQILYLINYK